MKIQKVSEEARKMNHEAALKALCTKDIISQGKSEGKEPEENTCNEKLTNENLQKGDRIRLKLEEDQKIAAAILQKRKLEEEEFCLMKKEAEMRRVDELEKEKKRVQKMKIDQLTLNKNQDTTAQSNNFERPKIIFSNNPLIRKFEELALIALNEKQLQKDLQVKKEKHRLKKHSVLNRSKQILTKVVRKFKGSQKISETSGETNITKSAEVEDGEGRKKEMQNYLISQVLFNGKEDVKSVPKIEEDYTRENEKQVNLDKFELKKEEAFFEAYKQNMEDYLEFVCEENKSKGKAKKKTETQKKLNQNCIDIKLMKSQFENQNDDKQDYKPDKDNLKNDIRKLSSSKLCFKDKNEENVVGSNKTYVPVIIDKEAFERTVGLFEADKQKEDNDKRLSEIRMKKKELMNKVKSELKNLGMEPKLTNRKEQKISVKSNEKVNITQKNENDQKDVEVPKWISVFLEKSKKNVPEEKGKIEKQEFTDDLFFSKEYEERIQPMLDLIDDDKGGNQNQNQTTLKLDMNNTESFNLRKKTFEEVNKPSKEEIAESNIQNYPGFLDKISKVKAMLSKSSNSSTRTSTTKIIPSKDTGKIKGKFENQFASSDSENDIEIYRPKKKLINVPNIVEEFQAPLEKIEKKWKWKQPNNSDPTVGDKEQEGELLYSKLDLESSSIEDEVNQIEQEIDQIMFVEEFISDSDFEKNQMDIENIQAYLDLIDERQEEEKISFLTPEQYFRNNKDLDTIKDKLCNSTFETKRTQNKEVGKLSHNFGNINKKNQMLSKEKERNEPRKDFTKMKKSIFESQDEKKNFISLPKEKVKKKLVEDPFQKSQNYSLAEKKNIKDCKYKFSSPTIKDDNLKCPTKLSHSSSLQSLPTTNQTALIPKAGPNNSSDLKKGVVKIRTYSDSDLDDILNYENSEEIANYEKQLRNQYSLEESDSSQESICKEETKKTDSFANLMNILSVMKKTKLSRSVSNSKSSLLENMSQKKASCSQIDISEISGLHQSLRNIYENGSQNLNTQKEYKEDKILAKENIADKKNLWEKLLPGNTESVQKLCEEKNAEQSQKCENNPLMRKATSCRNISWGRFSSELDEETMVNISESKQSIMEMFESAAPKYKFGGSLSNINNDKKVIRKQNTTVIKQVKQEYDERKWVLDSINKHFDVILEEEEDESDSAYDDSDGEECWSESEEEIEKEKPEPGKKSSVAMQGLLKSVVSKIRKSCSNLDDKDVIGSLKSQLEQR